MQQKHCLLCIRVTGQEPTVFGRVNAQYHFRDRFGKCCLPNSYKTQVRVSRMHHPSLGYEVNVMFENKMEDQEKFSKENKVKYSMT